MCLPTGTESNTFYASAGRYVLVWTDRQYRTGLFLHTLFPYPKTLFPYPVIVTPGCFRSALRLSRLRKSTYSEPYPFRPSFTLTY
jgi:hypothetical protein